MSTVEDDGACGSAEQHLPFVSIVMPALNEERYIADAMRSILPDPNRLRYEVLVVDGGSSDRTRKVVEEMAASNPAIRLLVNERRLQAAAVNIGARAADPRARFIVRADCHIEYPPGFVERCISQLVKVQAASVVVPMVAQGSTCLQRAIAAAQNSRLGNGGAAHRLPGRSGFVDHGHHAAFDRAVFLSLGGYNESFSHNEDAEFDRRLIVSGRKIYLDGGAPVVYYPRSTLGRLANQYFGYGRGRARTLQLHGGRQRARQLLPVLALVSCTLSGAAAIGDGRFLAISIIYAAACLMIGVVWSVRAALPCLALAGVAAIVMHMSWAAGFLRQWIEDRLAWRDDRPRIGTRKSSEEQARR